MDSDREGLLYISVPYGGGWKAVIDGKEAEIRETNDFGMGVYILPGEHTVEFEYHTPYARLGLLLMVIGILSCIALAFYGREDAQTDEKRREF